MQTYAMYVIIAINYRTSLPYFGVKLSCVCLMFAYRREIAYAYSYPKVTYSYSKVT